MADFTTLKTNVSDRGFSRLTTTQLGKVVNDAVHEVDGLEPRWPYLLTTTTGTLPLVTADLLEVAQVVNTTSNTVVPFSDYEDLASWAGSLTQTGADPSYWYFTPGSTTSISGYPVSTRTVRQVYWKTSSDLSAGGDTPLAPSRWHHVYEDVAVRNAMRMKSDYGDAEALQGVIDRKLAAMRTDLLYRQTAGVSQVLPSGWDDF
jgi:hypothetical protein